MNTCIIVVTAALLAVSAAQTAEAGTIPAVQVRRDCRSNAIASMQAREKHFLNVRAIVCDH